MDGLSFAASLMAVIQLAQVIGSTLKNYYEDVRNARKEIQQLYQATQSLKAILDVIDQLATRQKPALLTFELFEDSSGVLQQCCGELWNLKERLSNREKAGVGQKLKWPFQKSDVTKAIDLIERHKSALALQIGLENLHSSLEDFNILTEIKLEIERSRDSDERQRIVSWLLESVPKPYVEHQLARDKHEETTGSWLINSAELEKWKATENSLLWLNGGAGTGKSILCSTVIEHLKECCSDNPRTVVTYWYFTFADSEKQKVSNLISYLIANFVNNHRKIPRSFFSFYKDHNNGIEKPGISELKSMLQSVISSFDDVFIVVDALDECPKDERAKLFHILEDIFGWDLDRLHILITSRRDLGVRESFQTIVLAMEVEKFQSVVIQGSHMDHDIRTFLKHSLKDRRFIFWKPQLKEEVEEHLASKADGMFRLAALELETLSRLRGESKIRDAMIKLPKSLDLFYERSLQGIADEDSNSAHIALQWLAFAPRPLSLGELAAVMAIDPKDHSFSGDCLDCIEVQDILPSGLVEIFDQSGEIPNPKFDHCRDCADCTKGISCSESARLFDQLVQITTAAQNRSIKSAKVQFAHYSVKEYLVSARIRGSPASKYQLSEKPAYQMFAEQCMMYLLSVGQPTQLTMQQFFWYAASYWPWHFKVLENQRLSSALRKLALKFLSSETAAWITVTQIYSVNCKLWHEKWLATSQDWANSTWSLRDAKLPSDTEIIDPLIFAAQFNLHDLVAILLSKIPDINRIAFGHEVGGPLHCAARGGHAEVVRTLLAAGAYIDAENNICGTALYETAKLEVDDQARKDENLETCRLLLKHGTNVNVETGMSSREFKTKQSPLIGAIQAGNTDIVRLLLNNGANPDLRPAAQETALEIAISNLYQSECYSTVQILLEHGANPNSSSRGSVLHGALRFRDLDIIRLLIAWRANVHTPNSRELITNGQRNFCLPLSQHVVAQVTDKFLTINWIMESAAPKLWRNSDVIQLLLEAGADPRREGLWAYLLALKKKNKLGNMSLEQFSTIENKVRALAKEKVKEKRKVWMRNQEATNLVGELFERW